MTDIIQTTAPNVKVRNINIQGGSLSTDIGVQVARGGHVSGCKIQGVNTAILVDDAQSDQNVLEQKISDNNIVGCVKGIVSTRRGTRIFDNAVYIYLSSADIGIQVAADGNAVVQGNRVYLYDTSSADATAGIHIDGVTVFSVDGNLVYFDGSGTLTPAILIEDCIDGVVNGNVVDGTDAEIQVKQPDGVLVSDNRVHAIRVTSTDGTKPVVLKDNLVDDVFVTDAPRSSISDNTLEGNMFVTDSAKAIIDNNKLWAAIAPALTVDGCDDVMILNNKGTAVELSAGDEFILLTGTMARPTVEHNKYLGSKAGTPIVDYGVTIGASVTDARIGWNDFPTDVAHTDGGPPIFSDAMEIDWVYGPDVKTSTTGIRKYMRRAIEIIDFLPSADTAPVGAALIMDCHKDGTTLFSTQSNRPTVADGSNTGSATVPDVTYVAAGSYLQVMFDQIGSTTPGALVGLVMRYRWAD